MFCLVTNVVKLIGKEAMIDKELCGLVISRNGQKENYKEYLRRAEDQEGWRSKCVIANLHNYM